MESILLNALISNMFRKRDQVSYWIMSAMEACIETSDLWDTWQALRDRINRCKIVGLMKRRQRDQLTQILYYFFSYNRWQKITGPAVNHTMSHSHDLRFFEL